MGGYREGRRFFVAAATVESGEDQRDECSDKLKTSQPSLRDRIIIRHPNLR
jgi:hypothetical protein